MVVGKTNEWLESYAENTGPTRDKINEELGLHYGLGKELLLGIIYSGGSNIPSSVKSLEQQLRKKQNKTFGELIPKYYPNKDEALEVGVRIVESEYIQEVVANIKGISKDINDEGGFGIVEDGYITNVVGVRNHDISKTSQKMANLLQSIETEILYSVIRLFGYNIVCLYHDGFIVNKDIRRNEDLLVDMVLSSTEMSLDKWFKRNNIVPYSLSGIEVGYEMKIIPDVETIYERKTETTIYG
jgi:hypothetical protein